MHNMLPITHDHCVELGLTIVNDAVYLLIVLNKSRKALLLLLKLFIRRNYYIVIWTILYCAIFII